MHLEIIDWVIIIAFFSLSLGIGIYFRNRASGGLSDFFLGGRNLPWYIAGVSMVATTFAADTPLAVTELVAIKGISGNWLWWCFLAGGMLTTFFFARLWRRADILTEVEFIELRYSGVQARILRGFKAVYLGFFMNILIIGWVNLALISILQVFFDLSTQSAFTYTMIAMLIAAAYSALSGLWGVAVTDNIQFVLAMSGTIALAVLVVNSPEIGGITGLKAQLSPGHFNFFPSFDELSASSYVIGVGAFFAYVGVQWWASWYPGAEPGGGGYIAQRMMSTRTEKDALKATLFFQIAHYCLRPWPWIIVGLAAIVLYPDLPEGQERLGYVMAMKDYLPAGLKGLLITAFLAAYMSTISTQLNWGAGYLVNDLYKRFIRPEASDQRLVRVSRIVTVLIMIAAAIVSSVIESISGVWSFIIECGAGLGLVLILRWFWWRMNAWSEISATIAPFIGYALSKYVLGWTFPNSFFATVGFTTVVWLIVTFITPPEKGETLELFYRRVRPGGWWKPFSNGLPALDRTGYNLLAWLSSIVFTYSILFLTGKIIFGETNDAILYSATAIVSLIILSFAMRKSTDKNEFTK